MIDITRYMDAHTVSWPGDTPFSFTQVASISDGASVNLSTIQTSLHNGTHIDAPWHYSDEGERVDGLDLAAFIGPCVVVDCKEERHITPAE